MKKNIGVITLFLLSLFSSAYSQLKEKSVEKFDGLNRNVIMDASSGRILSDDFLIRDNKTKKLDRNYEGLMYMDERNIFSLTNVPSTHRAILKKYKLTDSVPIEESSLEFSMETFVTFFETGSFVIVDSREDGGHDVKLYNSNFDLLRDYVPFEHGFQSSTCDMNENHFVIASMSASGNGKTQLASFNNKGELLFSKDLDGEVQRVLAGNNYFATYCFNITDRTHVIVVYDEKGLFQWKTTIESMVQEWAFYGLSSQTLVIGTSEELLFFDFKNGSLKDRKKLAGLYQESNVSRLRTGDYIQIVDIKPLFNNQLLGLLLTEQTSMNDFKNNVLYLFESKLTDRKQFIKIEDSKTLPYLLSSNKEVVIVKDDKIIRYDYNK